ncbi:hypothetical protein M0208_18015 [Sphingomonas sp. SUN019]|uniref:hypothetical protein n=1 Tax=Sphingomonas sp. SUN019 TaxID=2937788 RepID=UPI00216467EB|nr:hypothetical protein [Sphingomonas sp. SUN019]UVO52313.1 hypothetical protein M0208_18015 [Sphingomonas sp. SUN019]
MRALLVLVGIASLVVVGAMALGLVNIDQTQRAVVQAPKFEADVARINVGTEKKTVEVPSITLQKPADNTAAPQ